MPTGAQIVLHVLESEGVDTVFGYPGGAIMPLYDALYEHEVRHILVRHEATAAFAASAYARTTGKIGVCIATSGPGATNLVTGIADAMLDNVPLLVLTGQVRSTLLGTDAFQEVDIASITQAITKRNVIVRSAADLEPQLRAAMRLARGPRPGPVLVDLPSDVLKAFVEPAAGPNAASDASLKAPANAGAALAMRPERQAAPARPPAIARTIQALRSAQRPVVIVGGGARWAQAAAEYREFCSLAGIPHTSTLHGLGSSKRGDPAFLGMLGMHGTTAANRAVAEADVLVALGMRFDDRVVGDPAQFARGAHTIVHADIDENEFNKVVPAAITLHGDLRETLRMLNAALREEPLPSFATWCVAAKALGGALPRDPSSPTRLSATDVMDAFFAAIPADTIVTTDVGQHQMWAAQRIEPYDPAAFLTSGGLGSMGFGVPAAIGAAIAHPKRPVVAIVGDGGFQMSLPELATLRRYELSVKILLIDNRHLGMVRQWQQIFYEGRYSETSLWDNPDFCAIAAAYGLKAGALLPGCDLAAEMRTFVHEPGAMLLHAQCFAHENVFPMIPSGTGVEHMLEALP